jgi:ABC-2 type transport system ATP-binding protein
VADELTIDVRDLRKHYGPVEALGGLTFAVPAGAICGFLGSNGAGKTTTLKVLLGMARPSGGSASVFGLPVDEPAASVTIRQRTGFVSEGKDLFDEMTVDAMCRFTASFYPRWDRGLERRYLAGFELPGTRRIRGLSQGTRAKLSVLLALCRGADLLLLDEPTSGLDPVGSDAVLQALVAEAANRGMTVLFSSHHIAEVEQVADHLVIVHRGRAVVTGALDEVRERYCRIQLVFETDAPAVSFRATGVERVDRVGRLLVVTSSAGSDAILEESRRLHPSSVSVTPLTLKEIFLEGAADA